jgi:hypothetical protein
MTFYQILLLILLFGALCLALVYLYLSRRKSMEKTGLINQGLMAFHEDAYTRPDITTILVEIKVVRDVQGGPVLRFPLSVTLTPNQQIEWKSPDGQLDIRFSPRISPFTGVNFATGKGGSTFSGKPYERRPRVSAYPYLAIVTTPDGLLVFARGEVRVSG